VWQPQYPCGMSLREEVEAALDAEPGSNRDRGAAALALTYAARIDGDTRCEDCGGPAGADLTKLGPALLTALEALGLTPRARKAVKSDGQQPAANPLDELAARRAGLSNPQAVDAAAP
jgi:hypothetical protein